MATYVKGIVRDDTEAGDDPEIVYMCGSLLVSFFSSAIEK